MTAERRFCIAGIEVALGLTQPGGHGGPSASDANANDDGLAASYAACPSRGGAPDLILEIERIPGFGRERPRSASYPAFDAALRAPRRVGLQRYDAEGELALPERAGEPVRGRFRVGESPNSLEALVRIGMSVTVPRRGGLVFHASVVRARHGAALFAGKSGAGKSTIAALLAGVSGFERLADELIIAMPGEKPGENKGWDVHVPPFLGGVDLPHGASAPLAEVHVLVQAPHHRRTPLSRTEAVRALLPHALVYVAEPETAAHALAAGAALAAAVPCYRLEFAKDPGVARVLGIT
ncbi:MAG TPA: hypothetical protein VNM90_14395 [Haliangium sp.]|nr:hypothetical protein [Haliangium sp.]